MKSILLVLFMLAVYGQQTLVIESATAPAAGEKQTLQIRLQGDPAQGADEVFAIQFTLRFTQGAGVKLVLDPETTGAAYICDNADDSAKVMCLYFGVRQGVPILNLETVIPEGFTGLSVSVEDVSAVSLEGSPIDVTGSSGGISPQDLPPVEPEATDVPPPDEQPPIFQEEGPEEIPAPSI